MKLKDLDMGIRETMDVLLLDVAERETKNGKPYTVLTVTDGDDSVEVKKWDSVLTDYEPWKNSVVTMNIKSSMYGSEVTYDADRLHKSQKLVTDFIPKVPVDTEQTMEWIEDRVSRLSDDNLKQMVSQILCVHREKLLYWSAAKGMHHALYGGLIYHMFRMTENADAQCDVYVGLNRDLLVSGVLLHDIGKLVELDTSELGSADYTTEGSLLGHAYIGMDMIREYGMGNNVSNETILQLQHMIASHHGTSEWGAVVIPKTMEAQMLHFLDMIDSKMYMYEDAHKKMEPNKPSAKIFGLGTSVYKF